MRLLACCVLVGCGSAPATLDLAMEPGATVPVWRGPQGGYHLDLRLEAAHFSRGVKLRFSGTRSDSGAEVCAATYPAVDFADMPDGWRCFFFDDPTPLVGTVVDVAASAEESPGRTVSDVCRLELGEVRTIF